MGESNVEGHTQQERRRRTKIFRNFKGVFTQSARNAIEADRFADLVNLIPIGNANLQTVPAPNVSWTGLGGTDTPYYGEYVNLNGTDYVLFFTSDGDIHWLNLNNNTTGTFGSGFGTQVIRAAQWKNQYVLFVTSGPSNGALYAWDGTTFSQISSAANAAPYGSLQDIAVCFGRVFVAEGRVLNYSGIDDFGLVGFNVNGNTPIGVWAATTGFSSGTTVVNFYNGFAYICTQTGTSGAAPGPTGTGTGIVDGTCKWNYVGTWPWVSQNGGSFYNLTDPILRSNITALFAANGYLYYWGISNINVISDLYVPQGASPPLPVFNNVNVDPIVGTTLADSIFGYGRTIMFATPYGAYQIDGVRCSRVSADIDSSWQSIDFTQPITGGMVIVNNILCAAFNIHQVNDPIAGTRNVLAMYFDGKWWFASIIDSVGIYSNNLASTRIVISAIYQGQPALFAATLGLDSHYHMVQPFGNQATSPPSSFKTALWELDDPLADKQAIRAGFEATVTTGSGQFLLYIDTEINSQTIPNGSGSASVTWVNNLSQTVNWVNNLSQTVQWTSTQYQFYNASSPGAYGKYLGLTFQATATGGGGAWGSVFRMSQLMLDYEYGARWR